ncbi:HAUS augmin-like complex subunit 4 isoform X2 [Anneissia japonica]|nr:HAUS augmin-like complex subunit 4 isoform X2 [Anneissia japonica]XP_033101549.1 HAUS augmin-like complex subunit 4 isoform X2 [Anneissia japonica]
MSLPVHITASDVEKNPEFVKLLEAIATHLSPNGMSKQASQELEWAKERLQREKSQYLQHLLLYDELQELLLENDIKNLEMNPNSAKAQYQDAVKTCLYTAEVENYLLTNGQDDEPGLLGLNKEALHRSNPHRNRVQSIQQQLIPQIEERLQQKCQALVDFHEAPSDKDSSDKLVFAKATKLPDVLQAECSKLEEEKNKLKMARAKRDKQFWQYFQALMQCISTLEELIKKHRLQLQADSDSVTSDWLSVRCQAMCLKIRVFKAQLLCDTYSAEVIETHKQIKRHLSHAYHENEKELNRVTQALQSYQALGMGFDKMVQEYEQLQADIENKRWALSEFKASMATSDDWR